MKEVVLFDKKGKEIDWYDPVDEAPKKKGCFLIVDNGYHEYEIPFSSFTRYEWRDKVEEEQ